MQNSLYAVILTIAAAVLVTIWVGKAAEKAVAINMTAELKNAIKAEKRGGELLRVAERRMPLQKMKSIPQLGHFVRDIISPQ